MSIHPNPVRWSLGVCAYRTAAEPAKTRQLAAASGGAYTTPPHSRHVQVVCPPTQLHGWCPTSARPRLEPMTARYLADRRTSGLGVEVHGGRAYRRLMVACETPLLSHAGSDDSRSSRRRHCPVKSGTDNGN